MKDKEQYKADIVTLKAKISNCCGQDAESRGSDLVAHAATAKLQRELEEMEQRVLDNQSQLDDALHERDMYKAKVCPCSLWIK